jgi:uncharacterized protein (TIGR04255 family)
MYEDVCYARNFLTEVIVKIDFVAPISSLERTIPTAISDTVSKLFPIAEPIEIFGFEFQLGKEGGKNDQTKFKEWQFWGKEREKQLAISPQTIYVVYKRYSTYEVLKTEFVSAVESLMRQASEARAKRFGLRYVNKLTIENSTKLTNFDELIQPALLCTARSFGEQRKLTRLFHIAEMKHDDIDIRFQFGFPNSDYPAVIRRPEFVMDLDAYVQVTHDLNESLQYMDGAHSIIQDLFEWSITDALRRRMND